MVFKKGYIPTEEHKRKISESCKGRIPWNKNKEFMKGELNPFYGKYHTKKSRKKMSETRKKLFKEGKLKPNNPMKNKNHSEKTKKKMSEYRKKQYKNGRKQWNDGLTKETHPSLLKMSKIKLIQNKGINNPNYKGGKSFEPYSIEFNKQLKKLIKIRDKYRCQICRIHNNKVKQGLCVHHIDYNKQNCNLNNLICLCHKCHSKTNSNRKIWEKYFKEEI